MALTYQPFAETPEVDRLRHDLDMNVPESERIVSGFIGAGLAVAGLATSGLARWILLLGGGALIARGVSGQCPMYRQLGIDQRHQHSGVPGNRGTRIEASVTIQCSAERLFEFWRDLEHLPRVMRHVDSVEAHGPRRSRWHISGPAGKTFEWDAEIINERPGRLIAWQSLPGASVSNAGSVWFEPAADGGTRVKVAMEFDPPTGSLGVALAELLGASPQQDLEQDLARFKEFAETELKATA